MHVLILTPGFPANEQDDSCIPALQSFVHALKTGHVAEVSIVSLHYPYIDSQYSWFGCQVYPLNGANVTSWRRLFLWLRTYRQIRKIHSKQRIDVIHSFWYGECALLGFICCRLYQIKHIITAMGQEFYHPTWIQLMLKHLISGDVVVLSERHRKSLSEHGLDETVVIPWALNPFLFGASDHESTRKVDLVYVGSLIEVKRPAAFIKIFRILSEKYPNLKAEMIGGGPMLEALKEHLHSLGLSDKVKILGQMSRREVIERLNQSRVLLHPSAYESFGFVYLEALCCGLAIVSVSTGIANETRRWKVVENEKEMVDACDYFLRTWPTKPERECHFNIDEICRRYICLYYA